MKIHQTYTYLLTLSAVIFTGCLNVKSFRYSQIQKQQINGFDPGYKEYCNLDLNSNYELNAVRCSFYGDYKLALDQATKRESVTDPSESIALDAGDITYMINSLKTALQNPKVDESNKASARIMLKLLNSPSTSEIFLQAKPVSAVDLILDKAKDYHYTLINEAHFNSQHRAFTQTLLKPLWEQGYRYLALETLSYEDSTINKRGYPVMSTGFYTKDSNFANLVREALAIGYQLIPYETKKNGHDGTLRDREQADNIYEQTLKKDENGKVLIHAGYGHIFEMEDSNSATMGYQLKKKINQDILTIDQVSMIEYNDTTKQHPFYRETVKRFGFVDPTVFLTKEDSIIIDPINSLGVDIQVYHPTTFFENGRPNWMHKQGKKSIPLLAELKKYQGHLIQAVKRGEPTDAVPVDQFEISEGKVFLLGSGKYDLRLINRQGDMIATLALDVN